MSSSREQQPLKLLALDGGGIRGLSELLIIQGIMHKLMVEENEKREKDSQEPLSTLPKPCDYFDLIGGTSTGGIIALMLGRLRMDIETAIERYDDLAKHVFSEQKWWGDGKFKATKLEEAIKSMVKDVTGDSEILLLDPDEIGACRTFVCAMNAHNMSANIPTLFRTYKSHEVHLHCKFWEAARATSATPTFFKRIEIGGRGQPYIDGGLGRNNPSQILLKEAKNLFGARHIGCLLSIGTGQAGIIGVEKPGTFQWGVSTSVINALKSIATDCESTHQTMSQLFENSPNIYFRLNVEQGMQGIQLSEWEKLSNVEAHTTQYMKGMEVTEKLGSLVNAIRSSTLRLTVEQLVSPRPQAEQIHQNQKAKYCPLPVASFTGRKEVLGKMHSYFSSGGQFQHVFVLYGLGGSGKSQLAFKFLQEFQVTNRFFEVFYIDATDKSTLEMDLMSIAPGDAKKSVNETLNWLRTKQSRNWLLLFDNADDIHLKLKDYFPSCMHGNILITTCNRELRLYGSRDSVYQVPGMDPKDALSLLLSLSHTEKTEKNIEIAEQIVKELHYFALAVAQAGAYICCNSLSLRKYQELYQSGKDNLLQNIEVQAINEYGKAVYATWRLSFDKLDPSAKLFLQICSALHHEGITERMFQRAALSKAQLEDIDMQVRVTQLLKHLGKDGSDWDVGKFHMTVKPLIAYSLLEYDGINDTYSIHPLVQHWSCTTIENDLYMMRILVLDIIGLSASNTSNSDDFKYMRILSKHITNAMVSVNPNEISVLVATNLAATYWSQGLWAKAEQLEVVVMEKRKQLLGEDHPDTLSSMANLAATYWNQGCWAKAEQLEVVVMEKRMSANLGSSHGVL